MLEAIQPWLRARIRDNLSAALRRKAETMDFVQDVYVDFLRGAPRFRISEIKLLKALLQRIAINSLKGRYKWWKRRRRDISLERPIPRDTVLNLDPPRENSVSGPATKAAQEEIEAWVRFGMELLESNDQQVVVLRDWKNLSFSSIGRELGIGEGAALKRYQSAVERLSRVVWYLRSGKLAELIAENSA